MKLIKAPYISLSVILSITVTLVSHADNKLSCQPNASGAAEASGCLPGAQEDIYGQKPDLKTATPLDEIMKAPQNYVAEDFLTEAKVYKVCQSKGCWLELKGKVGGPVRVTFKDYGFFVPKEILNKSLRLQGRMVEKTLSVKEQKHFLKDAKATPAEIEAVTEPKKSYEIVASGVAVLKPTVK